MNIMHFKIQHIRVHQLNPYMFALFSIFFLYTHNIEQLDLLPVVITTLSVLLVFAILHILLMAIIKDSNKSSLLLTAAAIIFFSHGHVFDLIYGWELGGVLIGRNLYLLIMWAVIFLTVVILVIRTTSKLVEVNKILFTFTFGLLAIISFNIGSFHLKKGSAYTNRSTHPGSVGDVNKPNIVLPDIYYIILDGYTNQNNLKQYYSFDNKVFLEYLRQNNFYVSAASHSNYATTFLSLTSSLNMMYLNEYCDRYATDPKVPRQLGHLVEENAVIEQLKKNGYKIVHFSSGYGATNYNKYADWNVSNGNLNELSRMMVHSSLLRLFEDQLVEGDARERILGTFDKITEVQHKITGPRFIFAHIVCPHAPYLFDAVGNSANNTPTGLIADGLEMWQFKKPYIEQVKFVNTKIQRMVTRILAEAITPPIIIIQGDHGSASTGGWDKPTDALVTERLGILNAIHLPGNISSEMYGSITPVNTFRFIFNNYFGAQYELLADREYFSTYDAFCKLTDVTSVVLKLKVNSLKESL